MKQYLSLAGLVFFRVMLPAADLPPDLGTQIPASAQRPLIVNRDHATDPAPAHDLPESWSFTTVAAAPLVHHPIMGCVDDQGHLFMGDAVGVNWNKAQLEANPPNRVLRLVDEDKDGLYDQSTVFADKMTFPQGAAWAAGSLYVCSPPGLWKLTDTNDDGVADQREMIVSGFDYTGNAADVHGPKLHPNGRLYWCHGRKGHRVIGKEGVMIHAGSASGIWSCRLDGSDVRWHSLGCADNPTGLAFTPQGEILGTCNLYYSSPRGDTLMHWLEGGVYERADQMQAIADLPRTLEVMPVVHNFGHVAVSGCAFGSAEKDMLPLYVTHFNTQRLVRMELTRAGSSFKAAETEFLKIHDPEVHLTDVIEDHDGSLLVLNTGGWFRIGCPSSLMAKPDVLGAVYRLRRSGVAKPVVAASEPVLETESQVLAALKTADAALRLQALAQMTHHKPNAALGQALRELVNEPLDAPLEHAWIHAARKVGPLAVRKEDLRETRDPSALRRLLVSFQPQDAEEQQFRLNLATQHLDAVDKALAEVALKIITESPAALEAALPPMVSWLREPAISAERQYALESVASRCLGMPSGQRLITQLLSASDTRLQRVGLRVLAGQSGGVSLADWLPFLEPKADDRLPLVLSALKRLKSHPYDPALQALAIQMDLPLTLRLRSLEARKSLRLVDETFTLVLGVVGDASATSAARIQATTMLASAPLAADQQRLVAPLFATVGPVELKELLPLIRRVKDAEIARLMATELARNPSLISQQESLYRTLFSAQPPEVFESLLLPALRRGNEAIEAKKRTLPGLVQRVLTQGRAAEGEKVFAQGKGTCIACHQIGPLGRDLGPNLTKIGAIRTERDLVESILFPSNTLARDYEAHVIETRDGQSTLGVIRSHTAEGLRVMDIAGQERSIPHQLITANTQLPTSLMPLGLDQTLAEQELLDLVAYLRALK